MTKPLLVLAVLIGLAIPANADMTVTFVDPTDHARLPVGRQFDLTIQTHPGAVCQGEIMLHTKPEVRTHLLNRYADASGFARWGTTIGNVGTRNATVSCFFAGQTVTASIEYEAI